jgi:hypothetical protein
MHSLHKAGVIGDVWHAMDAMQEGLQCRVRAKQQLSHVFELLHGILEGACSSPPKYSTWLLGLSWVLRLSWVLVGV